MVGALDLPTDGLRNLVLHPLAHTSGCVDQLLPTFAVGGTVVLASDPAMIADTLVAERIDMVAVSPRLLVGLLPELAELAPRGERRMGANPHANGGVLLRDLRMPDFRIHAVSVPAPGAVAEPRTGGRWESVRWNRGLSPPAAFVAPDYNRRNRYNRFNVIGGGVIPAELAQRLCSLL